LSKFATVGIVVALALVFYFAQLSVKSAGVERQQGPGMIALVQQQFEATPKLQAMRPVGIPEWVATPNAVDCKFQRPEIKNCWEVYFGANVEGPDLIGRKPGKVDVNFIIDGDAMKIVGGAPAGGLFARRGRL